MPFLAYIDARPQEPDRDRRDWQPNWRVWRFVAASLPVGFAAANSRGGVQYLLAVLTFALVCQAVAEALPSSGGLREWRQ
jgi:hypothetical protein